MYLPASFSCITDQQLPDASTRRRLMYFLTGPVDFLPDPWDWQPAQHIPRRTLLLHLLHAETQPQALETRMSPGGRWNLRTLHVVEDDQRRRPPQRFKDARFQNSDRPALTE